jgi:hypothetical protein
MAVRDSDVRFRGQSGHYRLARGLPLLTPSGLFLEAATTN